MISCDLGTQVQGPGDAGQALNYSKQEISFVVLSWGCCCFLHQRAQPHNWFICVYTVCMYYKLRTGCLEEAETTKAWGEEHIPFLWLLSLGCWQTSFGTSCTYQIPLQTALTSQKSSELFRFCSKSRFLTTTTKKRTLLRPACLAFLSAIV